VERWEKENDCCTEEYLRRILLSIIDECGKVKLKPSGSVYFVPVKDFHYIEKFAKIIEEIRQKHPDNHTEIWYAPIMNTDYFREMVKVKVEDTLQETLDSAIKRLLELSDQDMDEEAKIRKIKEISRNIESAAKVAEKYARMLQTSLRRTESLIQDAQKILEKVKAVQAQEASEEPSE